MELNQQSVAAFRTLLFEPKKHGLDFAPFPDWFEKVEEFTARDKLYKDFIAVFKRDLPKVFFYIFIDELYGAYSHLPVKIRTPKQA